MSSTMLPSAEWISTAARRAATIPREGSVSRSCCPEHGNSPQAGSAGTAGEGSIQQQQDEQVEGHRGSGGLVRGRAVFCLPPGVDWFQGHFAYAERGGCTASLGLLGTELPVDPCMQCCHGGFSRHKLVFIHHASGKECTLIVERYGGNMMSLHAEPSVAVGSDGPVPPESEFSFQTHVMKADEDARALLDRYFQSIVRAASDPAELRDCIVCIGQMEVPLSLLQELAAPLPDSRTHSSAVCSAFAPCRETPQHQDQQEHQQQQQRQPQQQQHQQQHQQPLRQQRGERNKNTPVLSPYPSSEVEEEGEEEVEGKLAEVEERRADVGRKEEKEAEPPGRSPENRITADAAAAAAAAAGGPLPLSGDTVTDAAATGCCLGRVRPREDCHNYDDSSGAAVDPSSAALEDQRQGEGTRSSTSGVEGGGVRVGGGADTSRGAGGDDHGSSGGTSGLGAASCHVSGGAGESDVGRDVAGARAGGEKPSEKIKEEEEEEDDDWLEG